MLAFSLLKLVIVIVIIVNLFVLAVIRVLIPTKDAVSALRQLNNRRIVLRKIKPTTSFKLGLRKEQDRPIVTSAFEVDAENMLGLARLTPLLPHYRR